MKRVQLGWPFLIANVFVWLAMVVILVVLPDQLERWLPLAVTRVVGWAVACGLWVITVETQWKQRVGPFWRFALQFLLWVGAALVAMWLDDQFRLHF